MIKTPLEDEFVIGSKSVGYKTVSYTRFTSHRFNI